MKSRANLKSLSIDALRAEFRKRGIASYRADQIASWMYRRGVDDLAEMTDLGSDLRAQLAAEFDTRALEIRDAQLSVDGTRKLALETRDGKILEAVLIPEERRNTICVSTQVGCPLACSFCATGALGFTRNLTTAEIIDQVCRMNEVVGEGETVTNLVFMGMGEPLLNLPAVLEAIRLLTDQRAFAMAPRRITVSTVGVLPRLGALLDFGPINLAVSLHATNNEQRDELVPLNRRFPLEELLGALREDKRINARRPVFFEYTLIEGVNDSLEDARRLPHLLRGISCKLNVIPMNGHEDSGYRAPARPVIDAFTAELHRAGMRVTLRRSRGADIDAACGQLAARGRRDSGSPGHPPADESVKPGAALVEGVGGGS